MLRILTKCIVVKEKSVGVRKFLINNFLGRIFHHLKGIFCTVKNECQLAYFLSKLNLIRVNSFVKIFYKV